VSEQGPSVINRIFVEEGHVIDEALRQAAREAILQHQREGLPVVICRNGEIVLAMPDELGVE
jgi:hypothetical protein